MSLLIVDLKSMSNKLVENPWDFKRIDENIKHFISYAKNSNYTLEVIVGTQFVKDLSIWKEKRLANISQNEETSNSPYNLDDLLEESFRSCGVKVSYPIRCSRIEAIVSLANTTKAVILSSSKKLAQADYDLTIFSDFELVDEKKELELFNEISKESKQKNYIKLIRNLVFSENWESKNLPFFLFEKKRLFIRDRTDFIEQFENPNLVITPLRQALYKFLGIKDTIVEVFPVFEKGQYSFIQKEVQADGKYEEMLLQPDFAIDFFFPDLREAHKRIDSQELKFYVYYVVSVTLEICSVATGKPFLEMVRAYCPLFMKGFKEEDFLVFGKNNKKKESRQISKKIGEVIDGMGEENRSDKVGKNFVCKRCQRNFFISDREFDFFVSNKMNLPKRCSECRRINRNEKLYPPKKPEREIIKEKVKEVYRKGEGDKKLFKTMNKKEKFNVLMDI